MKKNFSIFLLLLAAVLILAGCSQNSGGAPTPVVTEKAKSTPPPDYADRTNPLEDGNAADSEAAVEKGQRQFQANCTSCHGPAGRGDGPAGAALDPKPGNLTLPGLSDAYLYWRIAEGGGFEPFRSAMPAWKSLMREEQIWQVITYIRTLAQ